MYNYWKILRFYACEDILGVKSHGLRPYFLEIFSIKILTWEYWHIVTGIWFDWTGLIPIQGAQWTFELFKRGEKRTESCWRRLVELWIQKIEQLRLSINVKWGNDLLKVNSKNNTSIYGENDWILW